MEIITPKTIIVPEELFDPATAEEMLAVNGTPCSPTETAVYSRPFAYGEGRKHAVAVMALDKTKIGKTPVEYTSPLLALISPREMSVAMRKSGSTLFFAVHTTSLKLAEAIPVHDKADLLYLAEMLHQQFRLADFTLVVSGENAKEIKKTIGKRFNKTICE